jgi:hypothetical protein
MLKLRIEIRDETDAHVRDLRAEVELQPPHLTATSCNLHYAKVCYHDAA